MLNYKRFNIIVGWVLFAASLVVYMLTLEPSVPLWDCGEFISASYTLQVVHPPGAPLFLMLGRLFSLFSWGNPEGIALAVNALSAVASALTVTFTFWIITHFALKALNIPISSREIKSGDAIGVFGAGIVGALALTFMDTFWFSAVEAEVYASSSLFTALAFWGILKWEVVKDETGADRWLVFISFIVGLAIGLHLLNLLVIPAVILYYFFNRFPVNTRNVIYSLVIGAGSLVFLNWFVIPGMAKFAALFDKAFVNGMGLPYNSGVLFWVALVIFGVFLGIRWTIRKRKPLLNLAMLCFAYILIGYSSYAMVVIRSLAQPPIDMNNPEDAYSLLSYIQREQYGDRPLFKGPHYVAKDVSPIDVKEGAMSYRKGENGYEEIGRRYSYTWPDKYETLLPRMGDMSEKSQGYKFWYNERKNADGSTKIPTMKQNLGFMWNYQLGWMYWRYFFWNFGGRQSDIQNVDNSAFDGNWMSGIPFIDNRRIGPQEGIPKSLASNKARNVYYLLPFLLGVLGLVFQFNRQKLDATVVTALFIFTGIFIVIYLNQPPLEPRERDYTNVGSYQTFCIWIGLGVLQISELLKRYLGKSAAAGVATVLGLFMAPYLMGTENWDDHDRSDRYLGISFAKNYLNSCAPNAVLFTNGDNDTYPLWYAQNVEGYRTDVRIINLSLLSTEWYAQALTRKYYDSDPLPMSIIPSEKLKDGQRDITRYLADDKKFNKDGYYNLKDVLAFMVSDNPNDMAYTNSGDRVNYMPAKNFIIPVDKSAVVANGTVRESDLPRVADRIEFSVRQNSLMKGSIVMFDIIATNAERGWERPIYFTTTTSDDTYSGLQSYFRHEGLTYRLVPIRSDWSQRGMIDDDLLYDRLMKDYVWGNMDKGEMFLDHKATLVPRNLRSLFAQLSRNYLLKGDSTRAIELANKSFEVIPESIMEMDLGLKSYYIDLYNLAGDTTTAMLKLGELVTTIEEQVAYFENFSAKATLDLKNQARQRLAELARDAGDARNLATRLGAPRLTKRMEVVAQRLGANP
ncbi:MAG: DUF2723 domain-containing protein [Flavobacteriales bacterium]|nr:DUF2723 domain-containing protein [Flavobacteriales bacterium]